jgi:hypothetical protein
MSESIADLVVKLSADTASFAQGMKDSTNMLKDLKQVAEGLALGEIGRKLAESVEHTIDWADKMGKLAQVTGLQVDQFSALTYAAKIADVDVEQLTTGLGRLAKNMNAAAAGTGPAAFRQLHIAVTDATGALRSSEAVLEDVAERFKSMPDGASKTAAAIELFGKAGARLIPFLNEGRDGIERLKEEAERLGVVIDEKTFKSAEGLNDNLKRLQAAAQGAQLQLAEGLIPALNDTARAFLDAKGNASFFKTAGEEIGVVVKAISWGFNFLAFAVDVTIVKFEKWFAIVKDIGSQLAHGSSITTIILPDTSEFDTRLTYFENKFGEFRAMIAGDIPGDAAPKGGGDGPVPRFKKELEDLGIVLEQRRREMEAFMRQMYAEIEGQKRMMAPYQKMVEDVLSIPGTKVASQQLIDLKRIQQLHEQISAAMAAERKQEEDLRTEAAVGATSQITLETRLNALRKNASGEIAGQVAEFKQLAGVINDPKLLSQSKAFNAELDSMRSRIVTLGSAFRQTFANIPTMFEQLGTSIVTGAQTIGQAFKNMAKSIVDDLVRVIMHLIIMRALSGLASAFIPSAPSVGSTAGLGNISSMFSGFALSPAGHAMGGDFTPGPMLVGESGPEIMVPGFSGSIVPNHKIAGMGGQVIYQIDARGGDAGTAQNIMRALKTVEDRAVARAMKIIKEKSKRT